MLLNELDQDEKSKIDQEKSKIDQEKRKQKKLRNKINQKTKILKMQEEKESIKNE